MKKFGYIYLTTNTFNDKIYVGKRQLPTFDPEYIGSGKNLTEDADRIGRFRFTAHLLEWWDCFDTLIAAEKDWISIFHFMDAEMYNISSGMWPKKLPDFVKKPSEPWERELAILEAQEKENRQKMIKNLSFYLKSTNSIAQI